MFEESEKYLSLFKARHKKSSYDMAMDIKPGFDGWTPYGTYDEQSEIYSFTKSFSLNLDTPLYSGNWQIEYYGPNQIVDTIEKEYDYFIQHLEYLEKVNAKYEGQNIPVYYIHSVCKELVDLLFYIRNNEEYMSIHNQALGKTKKSIMKIFISHASVNKDYGAALVELLTGIGVKNDQIVFTSNPAYGIPIGKNIFDWLKAQISENSFVVYLLSSEYYNSVACLNEMGAAWVIENDHAAIFLPGFDLSSRAFQNGAIDPREIGFFINNRDRITQFCQKLKGYFSITENLVILAQRIDKFILEVDALAGALIPIVPLKVEGSNNVVKESKIESPNSTEGSKNKIQESISKASNLKDKMAEAVVMDGLSKQCSKFFNDILANKLSDAELLLLHYIIERGRYKLGTGWQTTHEIKAISDWEDIVELNHTLSSDYESVLRKFELRNLTEVSAFTSYNNPKEVSLKDEIKRHILDLPKSIIERIDECISRNPKRDSPINNEIDDLPF